MPKKSLPAKTTKHKEPPFSESKGSLFLSGKVSGGSPFSEDSTYEEDSQRDPADLRPSHPDSH